MLAQQMTMGSSDHEFLGPRPQKRHPASISRCEGMRELATTTGRISSYSLTTRVSMRSSSRSITRKVGGPWNLEAGMRERGLNW
jgi:hypothetical protein